MRSSYHPVRSNTTTLSQYESTRPIPTPHQQQELENYISADVLRKFALNVRKEQENINPSDFLKVNHYSEDKKTESLFRSE